MSKIKNRDIKYVEESILSQFTKQDLQKYSGIKIRNSSSECYLKRINDDEEEYWVRCRKLQDNRIIELEIVTEEQLLEILNSDKRNYILK